MDEEELERSEQERVEDSEPVNPISTEGCG